MEGGQCKSTIPVGKTLQQESVHTSPCATPSRRSLIHQSQGQELSAFPRIDSRAPMILPQLGSTSVCLVACVWRNFNSTSRKESTLARQPLPQNGKGPLKCPNGQVKTLNMARSTVKNQVSQPQASKPNPQHLAPFLCFCFFRVWQGPPLTWLLLTPCKKLITCWGFRWKTQIDFNPKVKSLKIQPSSIATGRQSEKDQSSRLLAAQAVSGPVLVADVASHPRGRQTLRAHDPKKPDIL